MGRITYADKVALNSNAGIPAQNKVNDVDMNNVKNAINQLGAYLSATVQTGQPGKCYITAPGTLASGDTFNVILPTAVNPSANAQFSVDGGTTYYHIYDLKGTRKLIVSEIAGKFQNLYFNGTIFLSKNIVVAETNPTLLNGFINQAGYPVNYKNIDGVVYIGGLVSSGSGSSGATVFVLPAGCRPKTNMRFPTVSSGQFGYIDVNTDGTVVFSQLNNTYSSTLFAIFYANE